VANQDILKGTVPTAKIKIIININIINASVLTFQQLLAIFADKKGIMQTNVLSVNQILIATTTTTQKKTTIKQFILNQRTSPKKRKNSARLQLKLLLILIILKNAILALMTLSFLQIQSHLQMLQQHSTASIPLLLTHPIFHLLKNI
jgi:hypothetical protein